MSSQLDSKATDDDECTAFLQLRLLDQKDSHLLENWLQEILFGMQKWQHGAWKGRIILRPPLEANHLDYVCIFRFRSWRLMSKWLKSSQRANYITKLETLNICQSISSDLQEGLACFLPESMRLAGWKSLSGSATEDDTVDGSQLATTAASPPKWRSCIIIWLALQCTVLPWMLLLDTPLSTAGVPLLWRVVLSLVLIVPIVDYVIVPILDKACHCCLSAPKCPAVEPCLSLQVGCPCGCRPRPPSDGPTTASVVAEERFKEMEHQLLLQRRLQGAAKRRLVGRLEVMEEGMTKLMRRVKKEEEEEKEKEEEKEEKEEKEKKEKKEKKEEWDQDQDQDLVTVSLEMVALLSSSIHSSGAGKSGDDGDDDDKNNNIDSSDDDQEEHPVTICVAYRVKSRCVIQFEEWVHEMARQANARVSGFRGEVVCQTPDVVFQSDPDAPTHLVVFQFDTQENLTTWDSHSARRHMMLRLRPLLKENSLTQVKIANVGSFGNVMDSAWHRGGGTSTVGSEHKNTSAANDMNDNGGGGSVTAAPPTLRHDPQRWKMAIIVAFALFLEIWYVGIPIIGTVMANVPRWLTVMVDTFIGVLVLTYFLLPLLIYACKSWLFVPWTESPNGCCSFLQRGFSF